jgi:hypothetical protein
LFGEAGEKLIPLLDKGSSGIAEYTDKANALGGVLSDNTIKQLAAMKEHTEEAHAEWEAMTMHAKAQLIPAIEAVTGAFTDNSSMGPIVDQFYAGVLETFRLVATAAATVVTGLTQVGTTLSTVGTIANDIGAGNWSKAVDDAKNGYAKLKAEGDSYAAFTKKLWSGAASLPTPKIGPTGDKQIHYAKGEKSPKKGNENELNGQIAELNTQLKGIDDSRKEHLENLKSDFDKGLLDYRDYYVQVIATNEDYYKQEEAVQEKRIELAKQKKNIAAAQSAQQELNRIEHERVLAAQKASGDLGKEWEKRAAATVKYAEQEAAANPFSNRRLAASWRKSWKRTFPRLHCSRTRRKANCIADCVSLNTLPLCGGGHQVSASMALVDSGTLRAVPFLVMGSSAVRASKSICSHRSLAISPWRIAVSIARMMAGAISRLNSIAFSMSRSSSPARSRTSRGRGSLGRRNPFVGLTVRPRPHSSMASL